MVLKIGNKVIGENHPIFFIAEAGVNHNGSIALGKKLIDAAVDAKADAVKFQTFKIIVPDQVIFCQIISKHGMNC